MTMWFYDGAFAQPDTAMPFEDNDEEWHDVLSDVTVCDPSEKTKSPAVCAAEFAPGATSKNQGPDNLLAVHALVLDVDDWSKRGVPFTEQDLRDILEGIRFIAWTTFSSTPGQKKWRVVVPLQTPMPPTKFLSLWRKMNEDLQYTMVEQSVSDPGRLGFFGTVQSETAKEDYSYFIAAGERLDWTLLDLEDTEVGLRRALTTADLTRSPDWYTDDETYSRAKRYYHRVGTDVEVGGRHEMLLRTSCRLWWDFAAPNPEWVFRVLSIVNNNFAEPKDEEEVWKEVEAGQARTHGENRIEQPTMYGVEREPVQRATKTAIADLAKALKRKGREDERNVGRALDAMMKGHAYAEPVEARALAFAAASELAGTYWREQPDRLLDLMQASLQAQRAKSSTHPVPTDAELLGKMRHKQGEQRRRTEDREQERSNTQAQNIRTALGGRDTAYTSREYKEWEAEGFTDNQWILHRGREYFFFVGGAYKGPYEEKVASSHAHVMLSPAHDRLELTGVDEKNKIKPKPFEALLRDYGTFVDETEHCLYASKTTYIADEHKLIVATVKRKPLEACFVPEVDRWLRLFAGNRYDDLEKWLAAAGSFDRELSALLLVTSPNQGKKLLIDGLVRLWGDGGVLTLEGTLPSTYQSCPVLLLDERPPYYWKQDAAARLREMLSMNERPLKTGTLRGYLRLVLMGNSVGMLWRNVEELTPTERAATRQRLLTIDTTGDRQAEEYLETLGSRHRHFVTKDLIAKHVLHLQETVQVPTDRFVVTDVLSAAPEPALSADYRGNSIVDELGMWLYRVFSAVRMPGVALAAYHGDILVDPQGLLEAWPMFSGDKKEMDRQQFALFLNAFCEEKTHRYVVVSKGAPVRRRMRVFKIAAYEEWLIEQGFDADDVMQGMQEIAKRRQVKSKG